LYASIISIYKKTILHFHSSCDKGLSLESGITAGQQHWDSNIVSAGAGIPVKLQTPGCTGWRSLQEDSLASTGGTLITSPFPPCFWV